MTPHERNHLRAQSAYVTAHYQVSVAECTRLIGELRRLRAENQALVQRVEEARRMLNATGETTRALCAESRALVGQLEEADAPARHPTADPDAMV